MVWRMSSRARAGAGPSGVDMRSMDDEPRTAGPDARADVRRRERRTNNAQTTPSREAYT